jgi:hypothetical protein
MSASVALEENCAPQQELGDEKKRRRSGTGLRPVFTGWKPVPLYFSFFIFFIRESWRAVSAQPQKLIADD